MELQSLTVITVLSLEEKPKLPKSNNAVIGLYLYPNSVIEVAKKQNLQIEELEITSINQKYLQNQQLKVQILSRGFAWLDSGTHEALTEATEFVKTLEKRTSLNIACIEEIALRMKFISEEEFLKVVMEYNKSSYGQYLHNILSQINYNGYNTKTELGQ